MDLAEDGTTTAAEMDDMLDRLEASLVAVLEPMGRSAEVAASLA
jgi:hypothetical protein